MEELQAKEVNSLKVNDYAFIKQSLEQFRTYIEGMELTKQSYINSVKKFIQWLEFNSIQQVDRMTLKQFRADIMEHYSVSTVNTIITGIKAYYNFLEDEYNVQNIATNLRGMKKNIQPKKDALSVQESKELLDNLAEDESITGLRDNAIITLMMYTGLRTCEVQKADIGDIRNKNGKKVLYIQGKGHAEKDDFVELTSDVQKAIRLYLSERSETSAESPLFTSESNRSRGQRISSRALRDIIKRHYAEIGLVSDRLTAHSLRHTAITLSLLGGADIQKAQAMARHSNIATTQIYAHNIDRLSNNNAENTIQQLLNGGVTCYQ